MKRFKYRVRVGTLGERLLAQKSQSRKGKSQSACVPTDTEGLPGDGKFYLQDTALGRVLPWVLSLLCLPEKQSPEVQKLCTKLLHQLTDHSLTAKSV